MKRIVLMIILTILTGCDSGVDVFGIKLGSDIAELKKSGVMVHTDLIPSEKHFIKGELSRVPSPDAGSDALYSVKAVNGVVVNISAEIRESHSQSYDGLVSYARSRFGGPIATDAGISDANAIKSSIFSCAINKSCPGKRYSVFRKETFNALIFTDDDRTLAIFTSDEMKPAL